MKTNKKSIVTAVALALGISAFPQAPSATPIAFTWSGMSTVLDPTGVALVNLSLPGKSNQYQTPMSGTLSYDSSTGTGSISSLPFFFANSTSPSFIYGATLQAIGDGLGGPGSLILANMLWDYFGSNGIPVSLVLDATGFLSNLPAVQTTGGTISGVGVRPAVDGTYVGSSIYPGITNGYLDLGVVPLATTKYNTTPLCTPGGGNSGACMNVSPSGGLPIINDTVNNINDYNALFMGGDGSLSPGMGGSPMLAGPFQGFNFNLDITSVTAVVPVPSTVWLFGSGLAGLIGVARRKRR